MCSLSCARSRRWPGNRSLVRSVCLRGDTRRARTPFHAVPERYSEAIPTDGASRVVVERRGRSLVALISISDLEKLEAWEQQRAIASVAVDSAMARARQVRAAILAERGGEVLPDSADVVRSVRAARDDEHADMR